MHATSRPWSKAVLGRADIGGFRVGDSGVRSPDSEFHVPNARWQGTNEAAPLADSASGRPRPLGPRGLGERRLVGIVELADGAELDLADPLAGDAQAAADLLEGHRGMTVEA